MRVCIIGSGKVGFYLARTLLEDGIEVVMVEKNPTKAADCANMLDLPIIQADGTGIPALRQAGCDKCDVLVAVTGQDENNLMACQLAKLVFGVPKTAARVNNPKNIPLVQKLGIDIVLSGTSMLTRQLHLLVETDGVKEISQLAGGRASLYELTLPAAFPFAGKTLAEIKMPKHFTIVSITRGDDLIYPHGDTQLLPGDKVICFSRDVTIRPLSQKWGLKARSSRKAAK